MNIVTRLVGILIFLLLAASSNAGELPFDQKVFDELRASGKPVVLHIHSKWCLTCRRQAGIASDLLDRQEFKGLTLMRADHKKEKELLKAFNIPGKSTFVAFKGMTEVARSTGDTNMGTIAALWRKAL
jgi:thioredoxin 1